MNTSDHPVDLDMLESPYELTREQITFYRENAYIKLKRVLPPDIIAYFGSAITTLVTRLNTMHLPMEKRSTYERAFLQVMNLWTKSDCVKQMVFSKRLARIAAELMEVDGVRLYHDQALYKEPGGGFTPWHADQFYWPLSSANTTTAWIPLQATPLEMGPVEFSAKSHRLTEGRGLHIGDESESEITALLEKGACDRIAEPYELGEISFHAGWLYHRAGPNKTENPRRVMTIIYMDANMRLAPPRSAYQQADWDAWCPGAEVGEMIDTDLNPVLY